MFTLPIISVEPSPSTITIGVEPQNDQVRDELRHSLLSIPIPFLPVLPPFDWRSQRDWAMLSSRIGDWLLTAVTPYQQAAWIWGRDAFWITFVAANPAFPSGKWPKWRAEIELDGPFITYWIMRQENEPPSRIGDSANDEHPDPITPSVPVLYDIHGELWARFKEHVSILAPL
ncbi:hypothetical protein C8Q77DRAFT_1159443 [Trametes polyzona]|nr:hypothetical protein C8Q77DRAFT_1159443 [Trametes polyzona]